MYNIVYGRNQDFVLIPRGKVKTNKIINKLRNVRHLCIKTRESAKGCVVFTGSAMCEAKVFTLVAQRVHATLLVD